MIKIIHLITSLGGGGTENFLLQIVSHSPPSVRHQVWYLKKDGVFGSRLRALGIPVRRAPGLFQLAEALKTEKPDVLHTCLFRAHQIGRWAGHRANVPVILCSQRAIDAWQKPWHRALDHWTLPWCNGVLANSDAAQKLVEARRGAHPQPVVLRIQNGIDAGKLVKTDRWNARKAYGLPLDALIGGSLMRLHPEKGADRLPAFIQELLKGRPDLHLAIAGTGPLEKKLRAKTAGQPWTPRLHWVGWDDNNLRFLSALDFYWLLSREESFPQSLLEASALGIPWIAPDLGGTREIAGINAGALIYPPQMPKGAAHAAFEMMRLINELKQKAERAAPTIRARYSLDKTIRMFYQTVDRLLPLK